MLRAKAREFGRRDSGFGIDDPPPPLFLPFLIARVRAPSVQRFRRRRRRARADCCRVRQSPTLHAFAERAESRPSRRANTNARRIRRPATPTIATSAIGFSIRRAIRLFGGGGGGGVIDIAQRFIFRPRQRFCGRVRRWSRRPSSPLNRRLERRLLIEKECLLSRRRKSAPLFA